MYVCDTLIAPLPSQQDIIVQSVFFFLLLCFACLVAVVIYLPHSTHTTNPVRMLMQAGDDEVKRCGEPAEGVKRENGIDCKIKAMTQVAKGGK